MTIKKPVITYLPTAPIRYSGSVPNLSRRGGVRVHPIKDGGLNPSSHTEQLRTRDRAGNKLRDVIDPQTGFVRDVTSVLESSANYSVGMEKPVREPISGSPTGTLRQLASAVLVDGSTGDRVYLDADGRRIRTTDMGEQPIPALPTNATPHTGAKTAKKGGTVSARGANGGTPKRPMVPGTATGSTRITRDDVIGFLDAMARAAGRKRPAKGWTAGQIADGKIVLKSRMEAAKRALGG